MSLYMMILYHITIQVSSNIMINHQLSLFKLIYLLTRYFKNDKMLEYIKLGRNMDYAQRAKTIIKTELVKRDIDYPELADMLQKIGVEENRSNLSNKINRGTFSFIFVMQVFEALELDIIKLKD